MGQMKWIYTIVQNGMYQNFKKAFMNAVENNIDSFTFDNREFSLIRAKHICTLADKVSIEYDEYLLSKVEEEAEWRSEIARGK